NSASAQSVPAATPSAVPVEKETPIDPALAKPDTAESDMVVAEQSAHDQLPVPTPVPTAASLPQPTATATDNGSREVKRSEAERKSVERERRAAERKRSRLEAMYRKHEISS